MRRILICVSLFMGFSTATFGQHSVARQWNEVLLEGIRNDFARPTVHARNLFHISMAMYDSWSYYDQLSNRYLLGRTVNNFTCPLDDFTPNEDIETARLKTISYAAYSMIKSRFEFTPGTEETFQLADDLMNSLGYDPSFESSDFSTGDARALGNYIADCIIDYGFRDNSNELLGYENSFYSPSNPPLLLTQSGNPNVNDPNLWQPLAFEEFIDQSGNPVPGGIPSFLSPEWGQVLPFALTEDNLDIFEKNGDEYWVYHDQGAPVFIGENEPTDDEYKWGFSLVSKWSAHLDPTDGVMIDISPATVGNITTLPETIAGLRDFYDDIDGGDISVGRMINPRTNEPYEPQIVPRGDYTRVLAEFWADGPDSETPPGHWFTILNYVSDHPELEKRFKGEGELLDDLEWDIKTYFALGGAMHDAAVTAWGIKGYYDYVRPISAIRYMADQGQSSDEDDLNYSINGIPLEPGLIELVREGDPLAGESLENVGKIKVYAWKGPDFIEDPEVDQAGVDWILAENWWPYQRPTFVTPPFAGYVSGHSTFSRAAAEVLTRFTGDEYFPGGLGEFIAPQNEFLVFEEGPSVDIVLQWATYRDASDQTSLSRIWGGIHPPVDDIPGRLIGEVIGNDAFDLAEQYFSGLRVTSLNESSITQSLLQVFPNPATNEEIEIVLNRPLSDATVSIINNLGEEVSRLNFEGNRRINLSTKGLRNGVYHVRVFSGGRQESAKFVVMR